MDLDYPEKTKKIGKKRKHEDVVESLNVQCENIKQKKKKKKKKKRKREMEDSTDQTPTEKKRKSKVTEREFDVGTEEMLENRLPSLHDVNEPESTSKKSEHKKKKKKSRSGDGDEARDPPEEQLCVTTERENVPCGDAQQTTQDHLDPVSQIPSKTFRKKQRNGEIVEVDLKLLNELKEYIPEIESRYVINIQKRITYDLPRFRNFKKQGIRLRHGRFSIQENKRLTQNVKDFLALTGVDSATKLFHLHRYPDEKIQLAKLKKDHKFFEKISEGIPRSCYEVYVRGKKNFDVDNYKGRYTVDEIKSLKKFQALHGSNWKKISNLTGRSGYSLEKRFSQIDKKHGPWSEKELKRLLRAVKDYFVNKLKSMSTDEGTPPRINREMLYKKLPWFYIAQKVKTRCWSKCRNKWMDILALRMSSGVVFTGKKSHEANIRLIKAMYESKVDDPVDINWEDLTTVFGDVPPAYVQMKWHRLKVCQVPNWQNKSFGDIVDYLHEKVLPKLVNECKDLDEDEMPVAQKTTFLLSDIFKDMNEKDDDDDEDDDEDDEDDDDDDDGDGEGSGQ